MTSERDTSSKAVARTVAIIGEAVLDLTAARDLLDGSHRLIQHRKDKRLDDWLADAKRVLPRSLPALLRTAAVKAALTKPWSNGQTEGRTQNSNSSSGRCMAEQISICSGLA